MFTENDVPLALGKGLWATVTGVDAKGLEAADPLTGNVAWFGAGAGKRASPPSMPCGCMWRTG